MIILDWSDENPSFSQNVSQKRFSRFSIMKEKCSKYLKFQEKLKKGFQNILHGYEEFKTSIVSCEITSHTFSERFRII